MSARPPKLFFSIASYGYLEARFLAAGDFERGQVERKAFPDGERYLRITTDPWLSLIHI